MGVKAIYFSVQDVGKHVKKSKKRFIWKFQIDRDEHVLEMFNSYLSGKKQIILDGRSIHEVQKVTSSFQFPFQIKGINCMIVQHGEQFELRINNQVFSHLYNQEKMKREFQFEGEGGNDKGYGDEEEYGGNNDRFGGFGGNKRDEDRYEESSYKPKQDYQRSQTYGGTRVKGWDEEERNQRREEPKRKPYGSNDDEDDDNGFGFESGFDKYGPSSKQQQQQQSRSNNNDPFESYSNKYSAEQGKNRAPTQQNRGGDFGGFEQQSQKPSQQFGGFEEFEQKPKQQQQQQFSNAFDQFAPPQKQQQQQQQQGSQQFQGFDSFNQKPKMQHANTVAVGANDLLDLDFGGGNQQQQQQQAQPAGGNQNAGFDFFNQQQQQSRPPQQMNQSQGSMQQQQQQQQRNNNNLNDLMGLEFGATNPGTSQGSNVSNSQQQQPPSNMANFLDDTPQTQPQTQAQPQKKKDLWSTDLVSLNPSEALSGNKKGGNDYDYMGGNNMGYNRAPSGTNMGMSQQQYGGNMGMGGNMGNNMGGNMGGNMGYNAGYGGNFNNNTGMGMGGNQYGGFNNNNNQGMGAYGGGMGMNAGFGGNQSGFNAGQPQSNVNVGGGPNNASTPFDFM